MGMNYLSLEDFKKWVAEQKDNVARFNQPKSSSLVGLAVVSKLSAKKDCGKCHLFLTVNLSLK